MVRIINMEEILPEEATAKEVRGCMGCFGCLSGCLIAFFALPFLLFWGYYWAVMSPPETEVVWHSGQYSLQYEHDVATTWGHYLSYDLNGEQLKILPHVYNYQETDDYIYVAATEGYGIIDISGNTADVVLLSDHIPKRNVPNIRYHDSINVFNFKHQKHLTEMGHVLLAYEICVWSDGHDTPIGDGRFQGSFFNSPYLKVYGLYGNYESEDWLLDDLTGFQRDDNGKYYVPSPQGYAIVDGPSGTCRVYFTDPALAEKEYQKDIYVLDSFDDFTPEEQEKLLQVEKEGLP